MWDEAAVCREGPSEAGYYPNASRALGLPISAFRVIYPQGYYGRSVLGHPVFISRPAAFDPRAVDACLSLEGVMRYHWHAMVHDFGRRLGEAKERDEGFVDYQCLCVLDLKGLTAAHLNKKTLR